MAYTPMARISLPVSFCCAQPCRTHSGRSRRPTFPRLHFTHDIPVFPQEREALLRARPALRENCPIWFFWFSRNSPAANASCGCTCARLGGGLNARLLAEGRRSTSCTALPQPATGRSEAHTRRQPRSRRACAHQMRRISMWSGISPHPIRTTPHWQSRRRCRASSAARLERGRARTVPQPA